MPALRIYDESDLFFEDGSAYSVDVEREERQSVTVQLVLSRSLLRKIVSLLSIMDVELDDFTSVSEYSDIE